MSAFGKTLMVGLIAGAAGFAGIWVGDQGLALADLPALVRGSVARLVGGDAEASASTNLETLTVTAPKE